MGENVESGAHFHCLQDKFEAQEVSQASLENQEMEQLELAQLATSMLRTSQELASYAKEPKYRTFPRRAFEEALSKSRRALQLIDGLPESDDSTKKLQNAFEVLKPQIQNALDVLEQSAGVTLQTPIKDSCSEKSRKSVHTASQSTVSPTSTLASNVTNLSEDIPKDPLELRRFLKCWGQVTNNCIDRFRRKPRQFAFTQLKDMCANATTILAEANLIKDGLSKKAKGLEKLEDALGKFKCILDEASMEVYSLENMPKGANQRSPTPKPVVNTAEGCSSVDSNQMELALESPADTEPVSSETGGAVPIVGPADPKVPVQHLETSELVKVDVQKEDPATVKAAPEEQKPPNSKCQEVSKNPVHWQRRSYFCLLCKKNGHSLSCCRSFKRMKPDDRLKFCQDNHLHFRCLERHPAGKCRIPSELQKCQKDAKCRFHHHQLLHDAKPGRTDQANPRKQGAKSSRGIPDRKAPQQKERPHPLEPICHLKLLQIHVRLRGSTDGPVKRVLALVDHRESPVTICRQAVEDLQEEKKAIMDLLPVDLEISGNGEDWFPVEEAIIATRLEFEGPEFQWEEFKIENPKFQRVQLDLQSLSLNNVELVLGSQVQDLWMPIHRRNQWIRKKRALAYNTKLGWAIGGSLLRTNKVADDQDQLLQDEHQVQKSFESTSSMKELDSSPQESTGNPAKEEEKMQLSDAASKELESWMKHHFQVSDDIQETGKMSEVFQQAAGKIAEALNQLGFKPRNVHPKRNHQAPVNPKLASPHPQRLAPPVGIKKNSGATRISPVSPRGEQASSVPRKKMSAKTNCPPSSIKIPPHMDMRQRRMGEGWRQTHVTIQRTRIFHSQRICSKRDLAPEQSTSSTWQACKNTREFKSFQERRSFQISRASVPKIPCIAA
jgi:hypothetical protein